MSYSMPQSIPRGLALMFTHTLPRFDGRMLEKGAICADRLFCQWCIHVCREQRSFLYNRLREAPAGMSQEK